MTEENTVTRPVYAKPAGIPFAHISYIWTLWEQQLVSDSCDGKPGFIWTRDKGMNFYLAFLCTTNISNKKL